MIEKVERIKVKLEAPRVFFIMEGMLVSLFVFQPSSQLLSFLHFCSFFSPAVLPKGVFLVTACLAPNISSLLDTFPLKIVCCKKVFS